jgi:hypothetical protein
VNGFTFSSGLGAAVEEGVVDDDAEVDGSPAVAVPLGVDFLSLLVHAVASRPTTAAVTTTIRVEREVRVMANPS